MCIAVASGTFLELNIPAHGSSYVRFTLMRTSDVSMQFNSLDASVHLAIYGRSGDEKPDFAQYDVTRKVDGTASSGSEILQYIETGPWVMAFYNGGDDSLVLPVTFRFIGG